jgi:hypothetical protein
MTNIDLEKITELNEHVGAPALTDYLVLRNNTSGHTEKITVGNVVGAQSDTTITVKADGTGDYPTIQQALNAVPSGGAKVYVTAGEYALASGLVIKQAGTVLVGDGLNTQLFFNGPSITTGIGFLSNDMEGCQIKDLWIIRSIDNPSTGTGIDWSNQPLCQFEKLRFDRWHIGLLANDTANLSFYNVFRDITGACDIGLQMKGNPVNSNSFYDFRINCTAGAGGIGIDLQNGNGNTFIRPDLEPNPGTGITGIKLGASTFNNTFVGAYIEGNGAVGVSIIAGALYNAFLGGEAQGNGTDITDNGTGTIFIGIDTTGGVLVSKMGAVTFTDDITVNGNLTLGNGKNIIAATSTGTKIGTSTSQKLGFFNATPIIQPGNTTDIRAVLINLGLLASGGANPLDLNGGSLTAANGTHSKALTASLTGSSVETSAISGIVDTSTGTNSAGIFKNNTNFAHAGDIMKIQMLNGSDSGRALRIENSGTGKSLSATNGSTEVFSVAQNGVVFPVALSAAPSYVKGGLYFDTTLNKLRVGGASAWETVTSA